MTQEPLFHESIEDALRAAVAAMGGYKMLRALPRPKSRRGFAAMPRDQVARIASLGGKAVPSDRRGFSVDRELAARAGRSSRLNG